MEVDLLKVKVFLLVAFVDPPPPDSSSYLRKDFNKNFNEMLTKLNNVSMETFLLGDISVNYLMKS